MNMGHRMQSGNTSMKGTLPPKNWKNNIPFGYLTVRHGKSPFLIGKGSIHGTFPMAMSAITRGYQAHPTIDSQHVGRSQSANAPVPRWVPWFWCPTWQLRSASPLDPPRAPLDTKWVISIPHLKILNLCYVCFILLCFCFYYYFFFLSLSLSLLSLCSISLSLSSLSLSPYRPLQRFSHILKASQRPSPPNQGFSQNLAFGFPKTFYSFI